MIEFQSSRPQMHSWNAWWTLWRERFCWVGFSGTGDGVSVFCTAPGHLLWLQKLEQNVQNGIKISESCKIKRHCADWVYLHSLYWLPNPAFLSAGFYFRVHIVWYGKSPWWKVTRDVSQIPEKCPSLGEKSFMVVLRNLHLIHLARKI